MQQIITSYVINSVFGPGNEYLNVTVRADPSKFKHGDLVKVTIENIAD